MPQYDIVIAANRGPNAIDLINDSPPSGGLVSAIEPALSDIDCVWLSAVPQYKNRDIPLRSAFGTPLISVDIPESIYDAAYNTVSNETLWFCYHNLFNIALEPRFDRRFYEAWEKYKICNEIFANEISNVSQNSATVIVHDYHLSLVPKILRRLRPDLKICHFSHTPFPDCAYFSQLPKNIAPEILEGLAVSDAVGFHSKNWMDNFNSCLNSYGLNANKLFFAPMGINPDILLQETQATGAEDIKKSIEKLKGDRAFIVRVDRIEPSKNVVRGLLAFEELLERWPDLKEKVMLACYLNPSRSSLSAYSAYENEVLKAAENINLKLQTSTWKPIQIIVENNRLQSLVALSLADVVLVNPLKDGLNLVAKEASIVSKNSSLLVLSKEAGVYHQLKEFAFGVDPLNISETAKLLHDALATDRETRDKIHSNLKAICSENTASNWIKYLLKQVS